MKPVVVLLGRPNVGKSTLFNALTRSRAAIVADEPGVTRDRQYGDGVVGDRPYYVVDTGGVTEGLNASGGESLRERMTAQIRHALAEADAAILLVDAREGLHPIDQAIAKDLRRLGKPVTVAVNKSEGVDAMAAVAEFHALGLGEPQSISSAHREGIAELMDHVLSPLRETAETSPPEDAPRIAVIGRPNAGKSTLVNALLGEERVIVADEPGTTRDSIFIPLQRAGKSYVIIDTAGVRRRTKVTDAVEKFSAIKTLQALDEANVIILVLDAEAGVSEQDATLAGYVLKRGRALVVALNKWDALDASGRERVKRDFERKLAFLDFAPVHHISALERTGVGTLFASVDRAFASAKRELPTPMLNRVVRDAVALTPPPIARGRRIRIKFVHQGGQNPPIVVVHGNQVDSLPASYRRYLANAVGRAFDLAGTPVTIQCKEADNPFAGRSSRTARQKRGRKALTRPARGKSSKKRNAKTS